MYKYQSDEVGKYKNSRSKCVREIYKQFYESEKKSCCYIIICYIIIYM